MNILSDAIYQKKNPTLDNVAVAWGKIAGVEALPPMMWDANFGGPAYGFVTYGKAPMMLASLGGVVGDSAVIHAMSEYAKTWRFKHPSPWDFMFFMNKALNRDLGWFWYYWLFTTESVDAGIAGVETRGGRTMVTVRQEGEMPAPIVLRVEFDSAGPAIKRMSNAEIEGNVATLTWPVDVWFNGNRSFVANLDLGPRKIRTITLDPRGRFPDRNPADNVWTPPSTTAQRR
jgi:hypothetical protein